MLRTDNISGTRLETNVASWFRPGRFSIILLLLVVASFPDVVFGGRTFFYRDFGIFGYPLAYYHRESFWQGEIPLWNPLNNCGLPFLAQWNTLVFYPLSLFYLIFPLSWSLGVFCLVHLYLAGLGMYFLTFEWTRHRWAAAVAGIAFAFNGLTLSCLKWPNNIAALAWMPFVVWLVERCWRDGGRMMALAAIAGAIQMMSGGPEIILCTWIVVTVLWIHHLISRNRIPTIAMAPSEEQGSAVKIILRFFSVILLVAALSSIQLFPFIDLLIHSQRGAAYSDASWAMPAWGWANFFVPLFRCFPSYQGVFAQSGQYWISSYYAGIGVMAFVFLSWWLCREQRMWILTALGALSLVLALGNEGGLLGWMRRIFPFLQIVRFPIKFVVVANFVFPILASLGVKQLCNWENESTSTNQTTERSSSRRKFIERSVFAIGGLILGLIGIILWFAQTHPLATDHWTSTWQCGLVRGVFLVLMLAALVTYLRLGRIQSREISASVLLFLLWLDVLGHAPRLSPTIASWVFDPGLAKQELKLAPEPAAGKSRSMLSPWAEFRLNHLSLTNATDDFLYTRFALFANANLLDRIPKVDGFYSLYVREENQVRSLLYSSTNALLPGLERFLGVSQVTAEDKVIHWKARTNSLAFVTAGQTPIFADEKTTLRDLSEDAFEPSQTVYLPREARHDNSNTNHVNASVKMTTFKPHRISLDVEADAQTWLILSQTYYHPWKAYVDGQATPIWRANYAFQGVETPAGRHTVELRYEDTAFQIGAVISIIALFLCLEIWRRNKFARFPNSDSNHSAGQA